MPFEFNNAKKTLQLAMEIILSPVKGPFALAYSNHNIVYLYPQRNHVKHTFFSINERTLVVYNDCK